MLAARPGAALVTVHSFTPIWHGMPRAVGIDSLLYSLQDTERSPTA